ncbi:MAG: pyridoxal phosphate-dependent aminotransferase [Pyramidobacter sp.]|nr:pyridoxal phosphate-dependent aminotransferase [Pyramidobacter sp.]
MKYTREYFEQMPVRQGTMSTKWDWCNTRFKLPADAKVLPMWVADMDFYSPREVIEAVKMRADLGCWGYTCKTPELFDAIVGWVARRYGWQTAREEICLTPGVIPGFHMAIQAFTNPGDGVIIQPPVYYPFKSGVEINGRVVVNNPLKEKDGEWTIDFDDLEAKAKDPHTTMMIFCNPHNPAGRAWSAEDVARVAGICECHGVVLVSDEIHADLIMPGHEHHAACAVCPDLKNNCVTFYAPSKTFNLAGLQTAYAVIPGAELRSKFQKALEVAHLGIANSFGTAAMIAAYTHCDDYVTALCEYVDANMDFMKEFIETRLPELKMKKSQATYMVWVDFRGTGMNADEIENFILYKAKIATDMGRWFGPGGEGWLRFNLAVPRALLEKALLQLEAALKNR